MSLGQVSKPTVDDLKAAMDLIEYFRDTCDDGIILRPLDMQRLIVVAYGDCSFGNCEDLRSQMGALVVVTTAEALNGEAPGNVVDWRSCRTTRSAEKPTLRTMLPTAASGWRVRSRSSSRASRR